MMFGPGIVCGTPLVLKCSPEMRKARRMAGFLSFPLLIPVWQVGRINPQILEIYFRCVLWRFRRFPQERLLTDFPQVQVPEV